MKWSGKREMTKEQLRVLLHKAKLLNELKKYYSEEKALKILELY